MAPDGPAMNQSWDEMALVGRVARAHGNRGQVLVDPETDFPEERFKPGSIVHVRKGNATEPLAIENVRFHRGRPILGFAGVDTIDEAEALAGTELRIHADALQTLPAGSFYRHDLVGCIVEAPGGELIGRVTRVEGDSAGSRLVVEGKAGDILIPIAEAICVNIDIERRKIVIEPPEGLLDLNVTKRQRF
jgi:16S rRNA processing protein RimM